METSAIIIATELAVAFAACLFLLWVIYFRMRTFLVSRSYKFIFGAKICFAVLTGSGFYLVVWPLPQRVLAVQYAWFSVFATGCILSSIGYYIYSRDVNYVLKAGGATAGEPAGSQENA